MTELERLQALRALIQAKIDNEVNIKNLAQARLDAHLSDVADVDAKIAEVTV